MKVYINPQGCGFSIISLSAKSLKKNNIYFKFSEYQPRNLLMNAFTFKVNEYGKNKFNEIIRQNIGVTDLVEDRI